MERIQSAIARARAARQGKVQTPPPAASALLPKPEVDVAALWAALPEMRIDPQLLEESRIVAYRAGTASTPYDLMRTSLLKQLREHGWTRVAITSPSMGCGKTTTCLNLALSLARQPELRVMILDLDLRRPAIMGATGISGSSELAEVLTGAVEPEAALRRIGPNLAVAVNRDAVANPAELLSSTRAATVIDAIEAKYKPDVILFDMPPLLIIDDTKSFLDQVDCGLLIAASEQSTVAEIDRAGKELSEHTTVLGVVLNKCRYLDKGEGYGYGYGYGN